MVKNGFDAVRQGPLHSARVSAKRHLVVRRLRRIGDLEFTLANPCEHNGTAIAELVPVLLSSRSLSELRRPTETDRMASGCWIP